MKTSIVERETTELPIAIVCETAIKRMGSCLTSALILFTTRKALTSKLHLRHMELELGAHDQGYQVKKKPSVPVSAKIKVKRMKSSYTIMKG